MIIGNSWMKKRFSFLGIGATFLLLVTFTAQAIQGTSQTELSTLLTEAVAGVNAQTPMNLDEETRLDYASTARDLMIYNNTMINYRAADIDAAAFTKNIEEMVVAPLCENPGLAIFKQLKVTLIYRYLGKDGKFITEVSKDMSNC